MKGLREEVTESKTKFIELDTKVTEIKKSIVTLVSSSKNLVFDSVTSTLRPFISSCKLSLEEALCTNSLSFWVNSSYKCTCYAIWVGGVMLILRLMCLYGVSIALSSSLLIFKKHVFKINNSDCL